MLGAKRTSTSEASAFSAKRPSHRTTLELNIPAAYPHTLQPLRKHQQATTRPPSLRTNNEYEPHHRTTTPHCSKPPTTTSLIKDARGVTEIGRRTTDQKQPAKFGPHNNGWVLAQRAGY